MKRKSLILLPLLVLGSAAFASCEPKDPPVVVDPSKVASVEFASDADITVKMGKYAEVPAVTVLPETATDKTYSLSISDETVAVLEEEEGTWYVKGVATGTATITVTTTDGQFTDTLTVVVPERDPAPAPVEISIADLVAKSADDTENLYKVTGVVSSINHDKYGNMYLSSADGSSKIQVYGSAKDAGSITWTDYTETNYVGLNFSNPQEFITSGLSEKIDLGDTITMICVYKCYNGTDEIMGYVLEDSIVAREENATYSLTLNAASGGTVKWVDASGADVTVDLSALYWGQQLFLKATADATTFAPVVKINNLKLEPNKNGLFVINVAPGLVVDVTYELSVSGYYDMSSSNFGLTNSYANYTGSCAGITLAAFKTADYGDGIQMRIKDGVSSAVYNKDATTGNIVKIIVTFNTVKHTSTKTLLNVIASSTAFSTNSTSLVVPTGAVTKALTFATGTATYEFTFDASAGLQYFAINHTTTSGTAYISNIVVITDAYNG